MNPQPTKTTWVTKEGQRIKIKDMTDSHILNTIRMLERNAKIYQEVMIPQAYAVLSSMRGEGAQFCMEQEIRSLEDADPTELIDCPTYDALVEEAMKRNIYKF